MQQRYYDPIGFRFLSVDPVAAGAESFSRYWYANNNPFKYTDPDGRSPDLVVDAAFVVYDGGQFLGASAAAAVGALTDNQSLQSAGLAGMGETGANLGASALSAVVPGLAAPMARGALNAGEEAIRLSKYEDKTLQGSRVANRATDVKKGDFENNLVDNGWAKSVSKDGKVSIFEKDGAKYVLRNDAKSTGGPTADFYKAGSKEIDVKIRIEPQ